MRVLEFNNLPEVPPRIGAAKVGDLFLQGKNMIEQKQTKKVGDIVSMYKVTDVSENGYLTTPYYEKLEE